MLLSWLPPALQFIPCSAMTDYVACATLFCQRLNTPSTPRATQDICSICLGVFPSFETKTSEPEPQERNVETPCQHVFHYSCLHQWLSTGKSTCPICRKFLYASLIPPETRHLSHAMGQEDHPSDIVHRPSWRESARRNEFAILSNTRLAVWPPEDDVLVVFAQNRWSQRQRLMLTHSTSIHGHYEGRLVESTFRLEREIPATLRAQGEQVVQAFWPWV
jgi:hypothetical protein